MQLVDELMGTLECSGLSEVGRDHNRSEIRDADGVVPGDFGVPVDKISGGA